MAPSEDPSQPDRHRSRFTRHLARTAALCLAVATVAATTAAAADAAPAPDGDHGHGGGAPGLSANVTIFDPSMPVSQIQATLDAAHAAQVDDEMGTNRHAYLFKPGTYGTTENPLQIKVGYYT